MLATALNLMPIGQLDGGHILYSFVGESHKLLTRLFVFALLPLGYFSDSWSWIFWAALIFFFGMRTPALRSVCRWDGGGLQLGDSCASDFLGVSFSSCSRSGLSMRISATIITFNEERNIARAMESLRCCDEIIVVDSHSTDRTAEIAARLGARVIESPWPGYAQQKNLAAEHAANDWILSIDADEALSEALEGEIWQIKKNGANYDAYTVPRLAQYMGRWILHSGWYPDRKIRLYQSAKALWVGDFVHESVKVDGKARSSGVRSAAFYLRFFRRAFQDYGSIYYACGGANRVPGQARRHEASAARSSLDVSSRRTSSEARFSGWFRGTYDRVYGCALQFC